jgi:hypothetical protein
VDYRGLHTFTRGLRLYSHITPAKGAGRHFSPAGTATVIGAASSTWVYAYSLLAESGGLGMSFKIALGTLGSLAMFTAIRNASSRDIRFIDICRCGSSSK